MSIPDDIREIRRKRYMASSNITKHIVEDPLMSEDESLESILARVAIYEKDEKLAMDLGGDEVPDFLLVDDDELKVGNMLSDEPIPSVIERLIDPSPQINAMSRFPMTLFSDSPAMKFWQCAHCSSINLIENGATCMFCHNLG